MCLPLPQEWAARRTQDLEKPRARELKEPVSTGLFRQISGELETLAFQDGYSYKSTASANEAWHCLRTNGLILRIPTTHDILFEHL